MSEFPALEISHSARLTQRRVKQKLLLNISEKLSTYVDFSRTKSITHKHAWSLAGSMWVRLIQKYQKISDTTT